MSIDHAQRALPARPAASVLAPQARGELDAAMRAMPPQRLTGNGMSFADATALHAMAAEGVPWTQAACWIGACNLLRAETCERNGQRVSANASYRHAAAAFRFGQSPIMRDTPDKLAIYARALDAFTRGARLAAVPHDKVVIPYAGRAMTGWLIRPADVARPEVVIIFGGADGWREEYHQGALALVARGLGALLLDGPGQGETRLFGKLYLDAAVDQAFSAAVSFLLADERVGDGVGIWGNSLGGNFALRTAAADPRIVACCDNSGPPDPSRMFEAFPRIIDRFRAMVGGLDAEQTRQIFSALRIGADSNNVRCDLLILQGNRDPLVSGEDARALYAAAPSTRKRLVVWDDGDHCIYNHSDEKHALVADWFCDAMRRRALG
jgi:alpha-beta hydrolase superfamily lysophospholipase